MTGADAFTWDNDVAGADRAHAPFPRNRERCPFRKITASFENNEFTDGASVRQIPEPAMTLHVIGPKPYKGTKDNQTA
jgi:hypothetical protein